MALTNSQYDEIMRDYQKRQLDRQHLIAARREEIARIAPEITQLDGDIASISVAKARSLLTGSPSEVTDLGSEIRSRSARKAQILQSLGYPADYFEPPYRCPDCQDTGYIGNRKCHCFAQASIDLVYAQSNLANILDRENFSNFSLSYYDETCFAPNSEISSYAAAQNAYLKCRRFTEQFDQKFENILLFGDTGVGKTFLSHCVAKELLDTGHSVIYFSAHRLFDLLARNTFQRDGSAAGNDQNIFDCDLLIIDDLGTEMTNSFVSSQFFICLNERILHRKSTLISSNLDLHDIANLYSERVFSRISSHFMMLHLFGRDIRILQQYQRQNPSETA